MNMLTGYAAAHQHPVNIAVHLVGIPTIMLGVFIMLSKVTILIDDFGLNFAYLATLVLFAFYLTMDLWFSVAFLAYALPVAFFATIIGEQPIAVSGAVAAATFFGGYAAQFVGHAIEKSPPVILKHPLQANLAAPFFAVVEVFKIAGLRDDLFNEVQQRIAELRHEQAA